MGEIKMKIENKSGVYIIIDRNRSDEENIVYKIGFSSKVRDRINKIRKTYEFLGQDNELEIFNIIYCSQARKLERHLHLMLSHFKLLDKHEYFKSSIDKLNSKLMVLNLADYK
jgi:hypothetical protein